jgi:hypothetical protein
VRKRDVTQHVEASGMNNFVASNNASLEIHIQTAQLLELDDASNACFHMIYKSAGRSSDHHRIASNTCPAPPRLAIHHQTLDAGNRWTCESCDNNIAEYG